MSLEKPLDKKATFIVRLFRGDVRLVITYWVFGSLINALINVAYTLIETSEDLFSLYLFFLMVHSAYVIFIYIAIWRSAGKYQGRAVWPMLAKMVVIIGSLVTVAVILFSLGTVTDTALQNEIDMANKSMPTKIDDETLITSMALNDGDIHYNYTLLNWEVGELDMDAFRTTMASQIKNNACDTPKTRELLDEHRKLVYSYRDKDGNPITQIIISEEDCFK